VGASKEAELNVAVIRYAAHCLEEGDYDALAELGLDQSECEVIQSLRLADLEHLSHLPFALLRKPVIDKALFRRLIDHLQLRRRRLAIRDKMLKRDAPLAMMQAFFGMDSTEYAILGRRLKVIRHIGRPLEPNEADERAIWTAYRSIGIPSPEKMTLEDYHQLCEISGCSARTVWTSLHRYRNGHTENADAFPREAQGWRYADTNG
jgi:hypothetical protein